jgi:hypothetical protein
MSVVAPLNLNQIRNRGYSALLRELGPTGYVRFIQQFEPGSGDYTSERRQWTDKLDADAVMQLVASHRDAARPSAPPALSMYRVRPTGKDAITGYGVDRVADEAVLAEYRVDSPPFHARRDVYDRTAAALAARHDGATVQELVDEVAKGLQAHVPEYQVRVAIRLWRRLEEPLVTRHRGRYFVVNRESFLADTANLWTSLARSKHVVHGLPPQ